MKAKLLIFLSSFLLIIPMFYIIVCIQFNLDILHSINILKELYTQQFILKNKLKLEVYSSFAYASLPTIFAFITLLGSLKKQTYGYAKFADLSYILKKMKLNLKKGFTFCLVKGKTIKTDDRRSTLVIAAPGTGKTSGIVVPNLLTLPTSAIILDTKGEIEALTSRYRKEKLKNEILIFNPFGNDNNFYFNPFDKKTLNKIIEKRKKQFNEDEIDDKFDFNIKMELINQTLNVLFKSNSKESKEDTHFLNQAKMLFKFFAIYDLEKFKETNFFRLMRYPKLSREELLDEETLSKARELEETEEIELDDMKLFFTQVANDSSLDELIRDMARSFERTNTKEFKSIVTTYANKLTVFEDYRVKKAVEDMNLDFEDLRKKNITIYIKLKPKEIDTLSPLITIILETIGKELLDEENNNPNERVDFYLDEFVRFGKNPFLLELPTLSRSYNIPATYLVQTSAQVQKYYSLEDLKILSGSCAYNIIFTINDIDYAKMVSESIGNLTRNKQSETSQALKLFGSKNKSEEGYALLTPQDLMNIPNNEVIISVFGHKATPIKGKVNLYFKNRKLKRIVKKYGRKDN
ncbi:hypothetical protein CPU12_01210 [Malaciobacter molluscorum LMG 25693]|uniref:P-type type IV conjugative transfer system coupling protein TraG/VirD4 n=1 Tax=Malaciobacter molluscorum LMG 25693 TaxID=870501 RepID=A0A2G1DM50_9BACT|nr:type IV secretory system conjugative DNA transfer family protein [Malaciobacter molluscorum]AXX92198.1 P-type type IV conjugative transfer system coupling protein TraG/VirD4 [Malaciobacter molluscorum LMG 25693]PHO19426.1 hypothetical protein CPU12_01210 [Malaciobacter molluscorum LMG 25693]